ncbi:transcriptional regulator [Cellulomonas sp. zg-ZUI168]|nr:transcriptional regulator [Cellulomonas fengjieae]
MVAVRRGLRKHPGRRVPGRASAAPTCHIGKRLLAFHHGKQPAGHPRRRPDRPAGGRRRPPTTRHADLHAVVVPRGVRVVHRLDVRRYRSPRGAPRGRRRDRVDRDDAGRVRGDSRADGAAVGVEALHGGVGGALCAGPGRLVRRRLLTVRARLRAAGLRRRAVGTAGRRSRRLRRDPAQRAAHRRPAASAGPRSVTTPVFDEIIHAANRLQVCAMLAAVDQLEFSTVRETLSVSDSVLSKHVKVLADAGYVEVSKVPRGSRTRTWLSLTDAGRAALDGHLAELRRIAAMAVAP